MEKTSARSQAPALAVIHKCWRPVIPAGIAGIQKPWMVTCRLDKCLIQIISGPQFHIPVDWIPAIPAGMTALLGTSAIQQHCREGLDLVNAGFFA